MTKRLERHLISLSAEAMGHRVIGMDMVQGVLFARLSNGDCWNPLYIKAHAFDLMCRMGVSPGFYPHAGDSSKGAVECYDSDGGGPYYREEYVCDDERSVAAMRSITATAVDRWLAQQPGEDQD